MGLLSSITKKVGSTVAKVLDTASVALAHPIKVATAIVSPKTTVAEVSKTFEAQSTIKKVTQIATGTLAIATTIGGAAATGILGASAKAGTAAKVVKSTAAALIPETTKGKAITAAAAVVTVPALVSSPKLVEKVVNAPSELAQFGADIGELVENPSIESVKELVKESPVISTAAALGTVAVVGLGTAGIISGVSNTLAIKESTKATEKAIEAMTQSTTTQNQIIPTSPGQIVKEKSLETDKALPQTAAISTISTGNKRRKRATQQKNQPSNINQRVNIIVSNSMGMQTKRYLNRGLLSH